LDAARSRHAAATLIARIQEIRSVRLFVSQALLIAAATLAVASGARGQTMARPHRPAWSFTIDVGGFVEGNRVAVTSWLARNAYGTLDPGLCGFDPHFQRVCDDAVQYPQASGGSIVAGIASVRRTLSDRWSAELFGATEQAGVATGRCDDSATPRDPRCTSRFVRVPFSGGSFALLAAASVKHLRVGAGPALLLANWDMKPAHLTGLWLDATLDWEPSPFLARAQYRIYRSANFAPEKGFSGFHPSTLFVGLGFTIRPNN
jgi:hypothetical protein